jgi:glycosyltransferase involved in cell wall biosynthesis
MSAADPIPVLFLIPSLGTGGAERVTVTLLRHLDRARFRPALCTIVSRDDGFRADVPGDVEVTELRATRVRDALPRLVALLWRRRPAVVFSQLSHLNLAIATLRPLLPPGTALIARESSVVSATLRDHSWRPVRQLGYRLFYRRLDRVVCQSRAMRDDLVGGFGLPARRAVLINNPIDLERVRALAAEPLADPPDVEHGVLRLVACARLSPEKGIDLLLDALASVDTAAVRLTVVGDGPMAPALRRRAVELGLSDRVRFVGFRANPYPYLARADWLVLSSRIEGSPNVVLESLACGTPVIATPAVGGVSELLRGVEGCVLLEEVSAAALARAIDTARRGARARLDPLRSTAQHRLEAVVARYERLLRAAADTHRRSVR